jgi:hypothetical protein
LIVDRSRCRSASWPSIPLRRLVRNDLHLRLLRALESALPLDHLRAEALHLAQHACVLLGHTIDGVEAVQQVVDRLGAEDDLDRAPVAAVLVERDEALGEMRLGCLEARARDRQVARVRLELALDPVELHVREVVGLDRVRELAVDLLDLRQHALRFRTLARDRRIGGGRLHGRQGNGHENGREKREDRRRLARARADYGAFRPNSCGTPVGARSVTSGAP